MIYAHFETTDQVEARAYNVYQYDWGQKLQVTGLESILPSHPEVHFALEGEETAITRVATVSNGILVVDVPFKVLQYAVKVYAYIYIVNEDDDGGQTIKQVTFTPRGRAKPDDDITPDEERTVDTLVRELNAAYEEVSGYTDNTSENATAAAASAKAAAASATAAAASATAAASSAAAASDSEDAAAESATKAAESEANTLSMYNDLTINIDGGDAVNVDQHVIDGGTAETTP